MSSLRRLVLALMVAAAALFATAVPAQASWYAATVGSWTPSPGVSLRDCYHPSVNLPPNTGCTFVKSIPAGTSVRIVCQRAGQSIFSNNVWDYVVYPGGEGFVSDYYMNTGYANWIPGIDICQ
ncbi:MAG TPA: hypothetical protein DGT23_29685 [Micromonosporaceae bacterium]|nr:hypothetical protein [Micromonosporaceae bacterium]